MQTTNKQQATRSSNTFISVIFINSYHYNYKRRQANACASESLKPMSVLRLFAISRIVIQLVLSLQ